MRSLLSRRALLAGVALAALLGSSAQPVAERLHVVLLHTNDVHGQAQPRAATWLDKENPPPIGGLPRIAAYVKSVRAEHQGEGEGVLLVDGGDWFQGTPEGLVDHGSAYLAAVAEVGYDAMAVGNHELDHGLAQLGEMIAERGLPATCANLRVRATGERVSWAEPWRVVEAGGVRIGVVGLLTPTTPSITHRDAGLLEFRDPVEALTEARKALAEDADWVLPITHLGVVDDRRLAKAHPDLDVVVGGHSHTYLKHGVKQGETFIVQAGSKGSAVGRLDLWFDAGTKQLLEYEYELVDLLDAHEPGAGNDAVDSICAELVERSAIEMDRPVAQLLEPLQRSHDRFRSGPAGNLITDVMRGRHGADVALQNRGGIRCDLPAGTVSRRNLFELLPFGNHLVLLECPGSVLTETVRKAVEGTAHTGLEVSGMTIVYEQDAEGHGHLVQLEIDGVPIDPEASYRVATNSFLAGGGDGYPELGELTRLLEEPAPLRELLEESFRAAREVTPPTDDRYRERKR
jgi:2',3'-cyclic-nucleotide 2'-phosphodiesterase (5'-nucleotidase family)